MSAPGPTDGTAPGRQAPGGAAPGSAGALLSTSGAAGLAVGTLHRSVTAAGLSFTVSDPRQPDNPLVYVNPAFERTTGYPARDVLGRNCRFLQSEGTDPAAVQAIRNAVQREEHLVVTLLNRRKDGSEFWNELSISPVHDEDGALTHLVGIQADVTDRVETERGRARALEAAQTARTTAEAAQRRLALLAEATSMLASTLDVEESLHRLTELVVPFMADWCLVELVGGDGELRRVASAHVDPDQAAVLTRVEELQPASRTSSSPVARVIGSGSPMLMGRVPDGVVDDLDSGNELAGLYRSLGTHSVIIVPLKARRKVLGAL